DSDFASLLAAAAFAGIGTRRGAMPKDRFGHRRHGTASQRQHVPSVFFGSLMSGGAFPLGMHARTAARRSRDRAFFLGMTTESGLSLNVTPDHGHVGDRVVLSPSGPDADRAVGGAASLLQAERDGEWVDLFHLVSWGEGGAPSWFPVDGPFAVPAIGLKGPVTAVVPPVEPGRYRICR